MKNFANISIGATIVMCVVTVVNIASAQTVILHADFNQDVVGEAPATELPGDPDGDYLVNYTGGGTIAVQASYAGLDEQPVVATRAMTGSFGIAFWVDPDLRDCEVFNISWRSVLNSYAGFCYLSFQSPNTQVMSSVEFRGNGLMTANGSANELVSTYSPGTPQLIEVRLDMLTKTSSVSIDGVPDPQGQDLRHVQVGGDGLRVISLSFGLIDTYTIALDDLHVTGEGCAGVANEGVSWGAVKARYR